MAINNLPSTSAELCRIVTKAEVIHRRRQVLALQGLRRDESYALHDVAGSTTVLSPRVHGRKLNHTYGLGMFRPITKEDLRVIELAYDTWEGGSSQPEIDVCDHADPSAFDLLSEGYSITGSICQYQLELSSLACPPTSTGNIQVFASSTPEQQADDDASYNNFIEASVDGFRSGGRNVVTLKALAESAVARSDTSLFSAMLDDKLVGTAVIALIEVDDCKVALLFMDSCLEPARGNGVHNALLLERIRVAKEVGCSMVIASARGGSGSARNIERVGFTKIFTCKTYTKDNDHTVVEM